MSIYVGNIPSIVDQEVIQEEFSSFGPAKISYFGKFAYIEYLNLATARQALLAWNGRIMGGQVLAIEYHFEQPAEVLETNENSLKIIKKPDERDAESFPDALDLLIHQEKLQPSNSLPPSNASRSNEVKAEIPAEPTSTARVQEASIKSNSKETRPRQSKPSNEEDSDSIERPKTKSSKFSLEVGDALIEANPEIFKQKKKNRHHPENSLIFCELCEKEFKKKYIRDHINSRKHISKQLN